MAEAGDLDGPVAVQSFETWLDTHERVLAALNGIGVSHPHVYARCENAGFINAPFFVMEQFSR